MALTEFLFIALFSTVFSQLPFRASDFFSVSSGNFYRSDPNIYYTSTELICADGYYAQEHQVVTDDGYILTVHRIPSGKRRPKVKRSRNHYLKLHLDYHPDFANCVKESLNETGGGIPVIMVHGILMASDGWLLQGPGFDLAYLLADEGYDVWLINVRGNFYSRSHKTLSPSNPKFWDFSFHENAYYDVPAVIDYVLKKTNQRKVFYVGYSMGTSIFFTMASIRREYHDKILGFVALAPVAYTKRTNASPRYGRSYDTIFKVVEELKRRNIYEVFPRTPGSVDFGIRYCSKGSRFQDLCYGLVTQVIGYPSRLVLREKLHLYLTHIPAGTSIKTFEHFKNNIKNNQFRKFDYGPTENMKIYGRPIPPDYPVWNVTTPVALYYSDGDFFYNVKDEEYLTKILQNVVDVKALKNFNHADFLWSYRAKDLVYFQVLRTMSRLKDQYLHQSPNEISRIR